ncbi:hypothetical protein BDD12DRAFT_894574 [Trichophaea hybrida]|nr:hypothetical protein BDD12DRAFT_894574 [Trichophaea hybrida]
MAYRVIQEADGDTNSTQGGTGYRVNPEVVGDMGSTHCGMGIWSQPTGGWGYGVDPVADGNTESTYRRMGIQKLDNMLKLVWLTIAFGSIPEEAVATPLIDVAGSVMSIVLSNGYLNLLACLADGTSADESGKHNTGTMFRAPVYLSVRR